MQICNQAPVCGFQNGKCWGLISHVKLKVHSLLSALPRSPKLWKLKIFLSSIQTFLAAKFDLNYQWETIFSRDPLGETNHMFQHRNTDVFDNEMLP